MKKTIGILSHRRAMADFYAGIFRELLGEKQPAVRLNVNFPRGIDLAIPVGKPVLVPKCAAQLEDIGSRLPGTSTICGGEELP